jgi:hypothetical protein
MEECTRCIRPGFVERRLSRYCSTPGMVGRGQQVSDTRGDSLFQSDTVVVEEPAISDVELGAASRLPNPPLCSVTLRRARLVASLTSREDRLPITKFGKVQPVNLLVGRLFSSIQLELLCAP